MENFWLTKVIMTEKRSASHSLCCPLLEIWLRTHWIISLGVDFQKVSGCVVPYMSKKLFRNYIFLVVFNMHYFEKGHFFIQESKKFFFCFSWGMKALMPISQNPWSDLFHLLNSRNYSHPKFKIVNIEVKFWEGAPQLF